ncbi:aKG-HExxH-type peptide beta-hydroxylase [Micromonosporaceae bacterium Da 78-11]
MRTFRLSDAAFSALAAGRPSPATLDELRKAQLSRHLLQLREILRATGAEQPRWYAEVAAAGPEAVRGVLSDPMTGLYAAAVLRAGSDSGSDFGRPGVDLDRPRLVASGARVLSVTHDGLTLRVRLEDADPLRGLLGLTPVERLSEAAADHWRQCLQEAWRILVSRHRPDAVRLARVLSVIVPVEPEPGAGGISATSADAFGAVAMSAPADGVALAVGLLHETQHSLLNAVRTLFDLVEPSPSLGYSPWRDDPRPAFGVLHGAYAYQAVTRFWRTEAAHTRTAGSDHATSGRIAEFEFARWRAAVLEATNDLLGLSPDDSGGAVLTSAGARFVAALRDEVAGWLGEPVDAEVAPLAAGANTDHRVRWRLRNLRVDPTAVVAAWRAGRSAPAAPAATVRPASGRALEHSERLNRVHELLRAPAVGVGVTGGEREAGVRPGGGVRAGDDAYLGGDHGTAFDAYRKVLEVGPTCGELTSAWSGLAVVSPWRIMRERPELVRAVHQELEPGAVDLAALIRWLDSP